MKVIRNKFFVVILFILTFSISSNLMGKMASASYLNSPRSVYCSRSLTVNRCVIKNYQNIDAISYESGDGAAITFEEIGYSNLNRNWPSRRLKCTIDQNTTDCFNPFRRAYVYIKPLNWGGRTDFTITPK